MIYRSLYLVTSKLTLTMLISLKKKKKIAIELLFKKKYTMNTGSNHHYDHLIYLILVIVESLN